jgi:hypothetical protein
LGRKSGINSAQVQTIRWGIDNHQEYMIGSQSSNMVVYGERYDLGLDEVEKLLDEYEEKWKSS